MFIFKNKKITQTLNETINDVRCCSASYSWTFRSTNCALRVHTRHRFSKSNL